MASTERNQAPVTLEIGNGEFPAPAVQPTPPNVLEQARLGRLDLFRDELDSGSHRLDFKAGRGMYFNRTPLHLAAMEGHEEIVGLILSRPEISREVVNNKDSFGYTPLHLAVRHSRENIVRLLTTSSWVLPDMFLAATSEPDDVGAYYGGCTPLHLAAVRGDTAIATLLLRQPRQLDCAYAPVNIYAMSWIGETPLDLARKNNFKDLVRVLENSDFNCLQQERAKYAMSATAILVGAALVAAAAFGAWLQPPGGIPNPDSEAPSPSWEFDFFFFSAFAFMSSIVALVLGTLATFPIGVASLKMEVELLREAVHLAQACLLTAIVCLINSFSFAASLVVKKFTKVYPFVLFGISWLPLIVLVFVVYCFCFWGPRLREKYTIELRLWNVVSLFFCAISLIAPRFFSINDSTPLEWDVNVIKSIV